MNDRLHVLEELEREFERVARCAPLPHRWWRRRGTVGLVVLVTGTTATAALAAGGLLTGEPVKDPPGAAAKPTEGLGTVKARSAVLTGLRVADPAGGPAWGLRTSKTTREQGCVQVGRVVGSRLGVLGQDGSFDNDGRFHELPPGVSERRDCQPLDAAGNSFVAISYQGLPASGAGGDCSVRPTPADPTGTGTQPAKTPLCAKDSLRILFYGTLGPEATSVTYLDENGAVKSTPTSGRQGAYLVVLRPSAKRPAKGYYVPAPSPGSGLRSVRYRDGGECRIRDPRSIGGAKRCPRVGYVPPKVKRVSTADLESPVTATFAPRPVDPTAGTPSASKLLSWQLTVRFTSRVAVNPPSYYIVTTAPDDAGRCQSGIGFGPVARTLRAGERVTFNTFVPKRCRGLVRGKITLHQPGPDDDQLPYSGIPQKDDPVLGTYSARIP